MSFVCYNKPDAFGRIVVLVGPSRESFLVPIIALLNLSEKFMAHVIHNLPREEYDPKIEDKELTMDHALVWEEVDVDIFKALGEFQLCGQYQVISTTGVVVKEEPLSDQDKEEFNKFRQNVNTTLMWGRWVSLHSDKSINYIIRNYFADYVNKFGPEVVDNSNPPDVDEACLVFHTKMYFLAQAFEITRLQKLAMKNLVTTILRAHLTYEFAGVFAKLVRFVYKFTEKENPLRAALCRVGTLVVNLSVKHPDFSEVFMEISEFAEEIMYLRVAQ
ncbi:hypothetical protein F5Y13DRAFT_189271 [Hypoxylon sp. FL1857]|nr:hypothetical protein F5Y13DRAFT_189271 [Hypoxylon sp. FL1857]